MQKAFQKSIVGRNVILIKLIQFILLGFGSNHRDHFSIDKID